PCALAGGEPGEDRLVADLAALLLGEHHAGIKTGHTDQPLGVYQDHRGVARTDAAAESAAYQCADGGIAGEPRPGVVAHPHRHASHAQVGRRPSYIGGQTPGGVVLRVGDEVLAPYAVGNKVHRLSPSVRSARSTTEQPTASAMANRLMPARYI